MQNVRKQNRTESCTERFYTLRLGEQSIQGVLLVTWRLVIGELEMSFSFAAVLTQCPMRMLITVHCERELSYLLNLSSHPPQAASKMGSGGSRVIYVPSPANSEALVKAQQEAAEAKKMLDGAEASRKKAEDDLERARADHTTTQRELTEMSLTAAKARADLEEVTRAETERKRLLAERVLKETARLRAIGMDNATQYNFAVCGCTGVGKSSVRTLSEPQGAHGSVVFDTPVAGNPAVRQHHAGHRE